jgi:hypothetical protein
MKPELYQDVVLTQDFPAHGLKIGDVGTLIEYVPHPDQGEEGCILEIFSSVTMSLDVVTVPITSIRPFKEPGAL